MIKACALHEPKGELKPFEYDPGLLGDNEVEFDNVNEAITRLRNGQARYRIVLSH